MRDPHNFGKWLVRECSSDTHNLVWIHTIWRHCSTAFFVYFFIPQMNDSELFQKRLGLCCKVLRTKWRRSPISAMPLALIKTWTGPSCSRELGITYDNVFGFTYSFGGFPLENTISHLPPLDELHANGSVVWSVNPSFTPRCKCSKSHTSSAGILGRRTPANRLCAAGTTYPKPYLRIVLMFSSTTSIWLPIPPPVRPWAMIPRVVRTCVNRSLGLEGRSVVAISCGLNLALSDTTKSCCLASFAGVF